LGALIRVQDDTVNLVHQSTKEYLREINPFTLERFSLQSDVSNLHITISCLTYLSFDDFENPKRLEKYEWPHYEGWVDDQFFYYPSSHWPDHMIQLTDELHRTPLLMSAFLSLVQNTPKMQLAWSYSKYATHQSGKLPQLTLATFYRLPNLIQFLLDDGADINTEDGVYGHALQAAAVKCNQDIVRYLVKRGADINAPSGKYGNVLQAAVSNGGESIIRDLVEHGADVKAQGGPFGNALHAVVCDGRNEIVRYFVDRGADVDAQGSKYGNAREAALGEGKLDIYCYLMKRNRLFNPGCPHMWTS
jgi:hypothetical protein